MYSLFKNHPFANIDFLRHLEASHCVGENTGWSPHHFNTKDSLLPTYIKSHSYGEYIFDWSWAHFYEVNSLKYYPKLLHAIPFTPVNAPKMIGDFNDYTELAHQSFNYYQTHNFSSEHYLFINNLEEDILSSLGFATLYTHQYHFKNTYESFENFLSSLKKNRRKNIKKERQKVLDSEIEISWHTHDLITEEIINELYLCYLSTIMKKNSYAYLTREFFLGLQKENILIIKAQKERETIAMALFFYSDDVLYGRNWGMNPKYAKIYPFLHFELCYYQGIEFCINKKLSLFEAGAQGEHKLTRGFEATLIKSAHHIKIDQCFEIIKKDIARQNQLTLRNIETLNQNLPYKKWP